MHSDRQKKSIFRSLFVPLILMMVLQAILFYVVAVYGGMEESLNQNAADILSERIINRKNAIETLFNTRWANLDDCADTLDELYARHEREAGEYPLTLGAKHEIAFLNDAATLLIDTLRRNQVNGVFLILNDQKTRAPFAAGQKYGLCIRDMDQQSGYAGKDDLLIERAPSSLVDVIGCPLDSWWEPKYTFASEAEGDYYYAPLGAAYGNPQADGDDLAYLSGAHRISGADPAMISYSIPLMTDDGYPYAVLGVELSTRYLASLMPAQELNEPDRCCYILAIREPETETYAPIVATGALYSRCFDADAAISAADRAKTGGFLLTGRGDVRLYGDLAAVRVYNNNNPFEDRELTVVAVVESAVLFAYIGRVKLALLVVALICLAMGLIGIAYVSRRFAAPITALAGRVRRTNLKTDGALGHLGITEIDLLVDSIEELNRNVNKNSARTEFFSRMSHDMRTPMNAIISFSSPELLDGASEAVKDDYLKKIHASGEFLLSLINEVLDMTRIESDKTELRAETAQACALFDTVSPIIDTLARKKNVAFARDIPIDPGLYVAVDSQHLNKIVMNLLANAVKFTPSGGSVSLRADASPVAGAPDRTLLTIRVSDTGIGMSEEFIKNLYVPFEQENAGQEGSGLGLSIAKKLVDLMGGGIECVSRRYEGTTFTVTLPLALRERPEEGDAGGAKDETGAEALVGKRVLVCEDNAVNTMIICRLLEKYGAETVAAQNGREGVEQFSASPEKAFDAVLMDIRMPVMDGLAATRAIRALHRADARTVPIIAMTANAFEQDEKASADAGMNAHMAKPIEPDKLIRVMAGLLRDRRE